MGITKDTRPKDWAYVARIRPEHLPSVLDMIKQIRETHNTDLIEQFNQRCEMHVQGEKKDPQMLGVTMSADLTVNGGLQQCINLILGTSSTRWSHIGMTVGGGSAPAVTDTVLTSEGATEISMRIPLTTQGWAEPKGMRLFFGGVSAQIKSGAPGYTAPIGANIVGEVGVYNSGSAGATLLNRSSFFPIKPVTADEAGTFSEIYTAPIVVSVVVELCPVA